jgi:L-ascorbate metabolism protein UlaG (beta-lactamase superfamily)
VDILMIPIDAQHHILKQGEIEATRTALRPRVLIPMHYRLPDLEADENSPADLGPIDPWLLPEKNVVRLQSNVARFTAGSLLPADLIVVFPHSDKVRAGQQSTTR